jgi:hypothetical protein
MYSWDKVNLKKLKEEKGKYKIIQKQSQSLKKKKPTPNRKIQLNSSMPSLIALLSLLILPSRFAAATCSAVVGAADFTDGAADFTDGAAE